MGRFRHITDYYIETFGPDLATIQWCKEIIERNVCQDITPLYMKEMARKQILKVLKGNKNEKEKNQKSTTEI